MPEQMRALVCHAPRDVRYESVPDPVLRHPRDAIVRVTRAAISGSDLHFFNGVVPITEPIILGQEFTGIVEEVGPAVANLSPGDRVLVPAPIACGACWFCKNRLPTQCQASNPEHYGPEGAAATQKGGGRFGHAALYGGHPGGQAELVRVPFADVGPRRIGREISDEPALLLADAFPSGWWSIDAAGVSGGETVAVFGCGPVGLMAMKAAWLKGAGRVIGVDILKYRLDAARTVARAEVIDSNEHDAVQAIREMTLGRGADVCVDAAGMEAHRSILEKVSNAVHLQAGTISALKTALSAVRRGGTVSVVGSYLSDYDDFPLGQLVDKAITLKAGVAPVHSYLDELMALVQSGRVHLDDVITHRLPLAQGARAYELYGEKLEDCLKVVLLP